MPFNVNASDAGVLYNNKMKSDFGKHLMLHSIITKKYVSKKIYLFVENWNDDHNGYYVW